LEIFIIPFFKLHENEVLIEEIFSPVYISQKLRETDDFNVGRNNQKLHDNLSDFKKAYSAPSVGSDGEFNDSIQYFERSQSQEQKVNLSVEVKLNPFRLFTNSEKTRSAFTIVKKEFEKMVIKEENEEEIKECKMKDIEEETNNQDQKSQKRLDISNLLC